jgi:hypothetical protein
MKFIIRLRMPPKGLVRVLADEHDPDCPADQRASIAASSTIPSHATIAKSRAAVRRDHILNLRPCSVFGRLSCWLSTQSGRSPRQILPAMSSNHFMLSPCENLLLDRSELLWQKGGPGE